MEFEFDFNKGLRDGCERIALPVPDDGAVDRLEIYFTELRRWSKRVNLIAKRASDGEILEKHFLDSLTLLPLLDGNTPHLLDIGTGAGFPGLVCKTVKPELRLTLVEPRQKRVAFLSHITRTLGLSNVTILDCRVEDEDRLPSNGDFTHISSRAVSEMTIFMDMVSRFVNPGVRVICMKGPKWEEELKVWRKSLTSEQFQVLSRNEYRLPECGGIRHLLVLGRACAE